MGGDKNNEVDFWRELIDWWEGKYHEKAPRRMYKALDYARLRMEYRMKQQANPTYQ